MHSITPTFVTYISWELQSSSGQLFCSWLAFTHVLCSYLLAYLGLYLGCQPLSQAFLSFSMQARPKKEEETCRPSKHPSTTLSQTSLSWTLVITQLLSTFPALLLSILLNLPEKSFAILSNAAIPSFKLLYQKKRQGLYPDHQDPVWKDPLLPQWPCWLPPWQAHWVPAAVNSCGLTISL